MRTVIVYCSQTGSAKRYAHWLAEELGCAVAPLRDLKEAATDADLVVLCSWFHAAALKGAKRFRAYMAAHPEKRYAVVAVGATPMPSELWPAAEHEEAFRHSFPAEQYPDLPWCYCQGSFRFERLGATDRLMMRIYFKMLEGEAKRGSERSATALAQMRAGYDGCERSYLEPLLDELRRRGWGARDD